jgi:hypothetical protein
MLAAATADGVATGGGIAIAEGVATEGVAAAVGILAAGGVVSALIAATDLVVRAAATLGTGGAVIVAADVAVATAVDALTAATAVTVECVVSVPATATELVERGVVALGTGDAVAGAAGRPRAFGAPGRASSCVTLAICPIRGRWGIGEGARAGAAAARGRVAAPGPSAQVDDRGRLAIRVEATQRRHGSVRAGSGEIREANDPVRDLPAGRRRIAVVGRGVAVAVGHLRSRPARAAARCRRRAPRRCRASP